MISSKNSKENTPIEGLQVSPTRMHDNFSSALACHVVCLLLALLVQSSFQQNYGEQPVCRGNRPLLPTGCCPVEAGQTCQPANGKSCDEELGFSCKDENGYVVTDRNGTCQGITFKYLQYLYRIPACTITTIVHETCQAIYQVLVKKCLKVPETADEWQKIATGYERKWNFPHCIGALDGKHIAIRAPTGEGSAYFNYKHFHSIILLALVDSSYRFIYVDVGANGRSGDTGVFRDSPLYKGLEHQTLNVPPAKPLPETDTTAPFVVVGDDAFPLKSYLLKPFPERHDITKYERKERRVFDYRLSRARRCVENAFGILSQRFGIFQRAMAFTPEKAVNVTLAAVALHNFLIKERDSVDLSTPQLASIDRQAGNRNTTEARSVRDIYCEYFNTVGSVPWQFDIPEKKQ